MVIKGTEELFKTYINGHEHEIHLCNTNYDNMPLGSWCAHEFSNRWYEMFAFGSNPDDALLKLVKKIEKKDGN